MTTTEAKKILTTHQVWRRGLPPYDKAGAEMPYTPKELGEAIDLAILALDKIEKQ